MATAKEQWHLDKRVPIALILTLLLQMGAAVWWASRMDTRMVSVERYVQRDAIRSEAFNERVSSNERDIAVLASQARATNRSLLDVRNELRTTNELMRKLLQDVANMNGLHTNGEEHRRLIERD